MSMEVPLNHQMIKKLKQSFLRCICLIVPHTPPVLICWKTGRVNNIESLL